MWERPQLPPFPCIGAKIYTGNKKDLAKYMSILLDIQRPSTRDKRVMTGCRCSTDAVNSFNTVPLDSLEDNQWPPRPSRRKEDYEYWQPLSKNDLRTIRQALSVASITRHFPPPLQDRRGLSASCLRGGRHRHSGRRETSGAGVGRFSAPETFDTSRPLSYPDSDVDLTFCGTDWPVLLKTIDEKERSYLVHFCSGVPSIYTGEKTDLRNHQCMSHKGSRRSRKRSRSGHCRTRHPAPSLRASASTLYRLPEVPRGVGRMRLHQFCQGAFAILVGNEHDARYKLPTHLALAKKNHMLNAPGEVTTV
ncbi:hypothetical protein HPB50_015624 [Hyalomma asiaticum]|uniref:Uncharacterized protein n=1 Tax=Hyalomma asiaticum TaxID=266040 RepID=A0ACB7TIF2_HYAAI|nr:hypothetical protein HPB50_015624 [Hyalomma asiaticum]